MWHIVHTKPLIPLSAEVPKEARIHRQTLHDQLRSISNLFKFILKWFSFFQVAEIQALSSRLEVQNIHLTSDVQQCERSRSEAIAEAAAQLQLKQKTHDDQVDFMGEGM